MILCGPCHTRYEIEAMKLKNEIAKKYNAPLNGVGWYHDREKMAIKKMANALRVFIDKMPASRIEECRIALVKHFQLENISDLTDEHIQRAYEIEPVVRTEEYKTHGELVVSRLETPEQLTEFIHMWRKHFLEVMQPQHIHELWEVDRGKSELRSQEKGMRTSRPDSQIPLQSEKEPENT